MSIHNNRLPEEIKKNEYFFVWKNKWNVKVPYLDLWFTLIFTTLLANSADDTWIIFSIFFPENWIWHFMQIVSIGDNLH